MLWKNMVAFHFFLLFWTDVGSPAEVGDGSKEGGGAETAISEGARDVQEQVSFNSDR